MKSQNPPAYELVRTCCRVLDDKKAGDLTVLDVSAQSSITDYLVIATATSEPHLRALRNELEKTLDAGNVRIVGIERAQESGWMVIDAFDVMIHLFLGEVRERYGLERLWRDATELAVGDILQIPKAKAPAKKKAKAAAPKAKAKAKVKPKAKTKPAAKGKRA
jgi:ribosome-associated protein